MRAYLPIEATDLVLLAAGGRLVVAGRPAVVATAEFAATLDTDDQDELDLLAALAASDLSATSDVVAVLETDGFELVDSELGEVRLTLPEAAAGDLACLLIADVESQELSWFGVQELAELQAAIAKKG